MPAATLSRPPFAEQDSHAQYDSAPFMADNPWQNELEYPAQLPPPPAVAHRVWVLDCMTCGTFLTNRGMKAVLLLRPNVALFSSDALPVNCSASTCNTDAYKPAAPCHSPHPPPRTCECLTQTLCCHGCGSAIGYMIVVPCMRCTSSTASSSRSTNGHRFVFHSGEIVGTERYYIPNEPGVMPYEPIPMLPLPVSMPLASQILNDFPSSHGGGYSDWRARHPVSTSSTRYLPTPPLEDAFSPPHFAPNPGAPPALDDQDEDDDDDDETDSDDEHNSMPPLHGPRASEHINGLQHGAYSRNQTIPHHGDDVFYGPEPPRKLRAGEPLFWHNLVRSGEIPGVSDDPRSRKGYEPVVDLYQDDSEELMPILFGR